MNKSEMRRVTFGAAPLTIEDVVALAEGRATPALNPDPAFMARIQRGADFLDRLLAEEGVIYGVTTGYGDSVTRPVPTELVPELPLHLTRFHGCGLGRISISMPPAPCWRPGSAPWRREFPGSVRVCLSGSAGCWSRIWCRVSRKRVPSGPAAI